MYAILDSMTRLLAPILAFTSNEIWQAMPHHEAAQALHVMLNDMPEVKAELAFNAEAEERWNRLIALRDDVNKALELARAEKTIGKPLEAKVTLFVSDAAKAEFAKLEDMPLPKLFIVSEVEVVSGGGDGLAAEQFAGITVKVEPCGAPKCIRCWTHSPSVGASSEHPELCARCADALS
jgi:isoleucyl-tRNA synthetase